MPPPESSESRINRERFTLQSVLELARMLTPDLGYEGILRAVLRTVMGKALIQDSVVYLRGNFLGQSRTEGEAGTELVNVLQSGFRKVVLQDAIGSAAELSDDITLLPIYDSLGQVIALFGFGKSLIPGHAIDEEPDYIDALGAITSLALTNFRLFESEKNREKLESELRVAREIQQTLFPAVLPRFPNVDIAAFTHSSEMVGGDYYDVIALDDHRMFVIVADVVGKGVTAALTMSTLQAAVRALIGPLKRSEMDLESMTHELNRLIFESTSLDRFITTAFGILDFRTQQIELSVCGHPNPLVGSSDGVELIPTGGIPLGILEDYPFEIHHTALRPGSQIFLFTDGLTESLYQGEMVGMNGVAEYFARQIQLSPEELVRDIINKEELLVNDDITMVAIRIA